MMFSTLIAPMARLIPVLRITHFIQCRRTRRANVLDVEEMPESWQRDLGLLEGRDRRGDRHDGAFRLIHSRRSL